MWRWLDRFFDRQTTQLLPGERAVLLTIFEGDGPLTRAVQDGKAFSVHFRHREGKDAYEAPLHDYTDLNPTPESIRRLRKPMESRPLVAKDRRTGRLLEFRVTIEPGLFHAYPGCLRGRTLDGSRWPWDFDPEIPPSKPGEYLVVGGPDVARVPTAEETAQLARWLGLSSADFESVRWGLTRFPPAERSRLDACEARVGAPAFKALRPFLEVCDGLGWMDVEMFGADAFRRGDGEDLVIGGYGHPDDVVLPIVLRTGEQAGVFGACGSEWMRIGDTVEDLWRTVVLAKRSSRGVPHPLERFLERSPVLDSTEVESGRPLPDRAAPAEGSSPDARCIGEIAAWLGVPAALVLFRRPFLRVFPAATEKSRKDCEQRIGPARFEAVRDYLDRFDGFHVLGYRLLGAAEIRTLPSGSTLFGHGWFGWQVVIHEGPSGRPALFEVDDKGVERSCAADSVRQLLLQAIAHRS